MRFGASDSATDRFFVRVCVALATGLFAASCSPPKEAPLDSTVVRDSAGVEIVLDAGQPLWPEGEGLRLSSQPVIQIGTFGEGETALFRVRDALLLENGTIAVANGGSNEIKFFGPTGEFLHSAGRTGDAPGEFQDLRMLGRRGADSLLLAFDSRAQRVTEFLSDGVLVRTVPLPSLSSDAGSASARTPMLSPVGWLRSGALVVSRSVQTSDRDRSLQEGERLLTTKSSVQLYLIEDGQIPPFGGNVPETQSVARFNFDGSRMTMQPIRVPFSKTFQVDAGGGGTVAGNTGIFDIRTYDALGKLVRIIRRPEPPREVDADARQAWIDALLSTDEDPTVRNRRRRQYEQIEFPSTLPTFKSLVSAEDGRLWVEEFDRAVSASDESSWSVYDQRGYRLGQVAMPPRFRPFEIGEDYVLGVWRDDSDVEYVQLYDLAAGESQ